MSRTAPRPVSVTVAASLVAFYALAFILWDLLAPFERPYAQGPVSVVLGVRVYGIAAQLMHILQLVIAVALAYGLWTMRRWGWYLLLFVVGYMVVSNVVWVTVYREFSRILFSVFYLAIVTLLLALTYPHRRQFA